MNMSLISLYYFGVAVMMEIAGAVAAAAQQPKPVPPALVFDSVTVIDVAQGTLAPDQRVVIVGNRIQALGSVRSVSTPKGARVVEARGKYLIPGLWDMHTHLLKYPEVVYPLLLANGVTGIRDMGTGVPLDTLHQWRREILAGTRIGPPRQLFAGPLLDDAPRDGDDTEQEPWCQRFSETCFHGVSNALKLHDPEQTRRVVDSLQAAGADFIKVHGLGWENYFALVNEAHRIGIPFAGHLPDFGQDSTTILIVSDSGQRTIEHAYGLQKRCTGELASLEKCRLIAERHLRNGTWDVLGPTILVARSRRTTAQEHWHRFRFWPDSVTRGWADQMQVDLTLYSKAQPSMPEEAMHFEIAERAGLPMLIGTDCGGATPLCDIPGFQLHDDLSIYVDWGLTPLAVLQAVTLNPAKMLHATDSLGTVAPGKLADLVLLDGNPLADIWNTTTIRAVIANGRYFDRAALDRLLAELEAHAKQAP